MAKPKISMKGGRLYQLSQLDKDKPNGEMHLSKRSLKRRAAKAESEAVAPIVKKQVLGRRTGRSDALLEAERKRKLLSSGSASTKEEKALNRFCVGRTSGKQKVKGRTKEPKAFPKASQCAVDVFYADSGKKWGVEKYVDPLKTARIKRPEQLL